MTAYRCPLGARQPIEPMGDDDLKRYARRAYHDRNIVVIWLKDVRDEFIRQAIINEANRVYGKPDQG